MSKKFNYKKELRRMFYSIGSKDGTCCGVGCNDCPFVEEKCTDISYAGEAVKIVKKWSKENPERKINWSKVPKGVDVIVGDDGCISLQRKFYCYDETLEYPYITHFNIISDTLMCFKKCELADGVEIKEEWYE